MSAKGTASSGIKGHETPLKIIVWILTVFNKSPFLGFWVIQMGYWPDFNFENFLIKNIFICVKSYQFSQNAGNPVWIHSCD